MPDNAYDEIDQIVYDAIRLNADVLACIPASRVLVSDRPVDERDEPQDAADMGARVWILPLRGGKKTQDSSSTAELIRRYRIGMTPGNDSLVALRKLEWNLDCALVKFTNEAASITGQFLRIESAEIGESNPEKYPAVEPEEYQDSCDLTVRILHALNAFTGAGS